MNYTDKIHEALAKSCCPIMGNGVMEHALVELLQEVEREATVEVRKAHSAEALAHIETKKELQVYRTLAAQALNGTPCATGETRLLSAEGWVKIGDLIKEQAAGKKHDEALTRRCAELEAEVARLKDNWSNERDMLKTAWDRESAVGRHLREEIGRLRDGWKAAETGQEKLAAELRAVEEARKALAQKLEASLRAQEKLEKKIAGFREVLSPFKHLLEDL